MPRFYFDIWEGTHFIRDETGLEFDSLDAAEEAAARGAADIGRDQFPKEDTCDITVEVSNEHRQRVLTVTVSMKAERVGQAVSKLYLCSFTVGRPSESHILSTRLDDFENANFR